DIGTLPAALMEHQHPSVALTFRSVTTMIDLVNWNNPALAKAYLAHFDRNWRQSEPFRARY
ncbi:hypothetical protein, partial [Streptomyces sp. NPDC001056]